MRVLALACTMRNETLRIVTERYGTLQKRYGVSQRAVEHYGALHDVTGRYGTFRDRYSALMERYGTIMENIDFAHH